MGRRDIHMQRLMGSAAIIFGVVVATNALVAGPHAFMSGVSAVVSMVIAGIACIGAGIWEILRSKRIK
jgi:hypothetical protein